MTDLNVKRALAEDHSDCTVNHSHEWEPEASVEVHVTLGGVEYPLCRRHAQQLREMLDEELAVKS